jgi:hypothetical protein
MTSAKDRTWINVHLKTEMHKRLNAWCRRNGLNQQDGLEAMIDICAREVNGLQLVRRPDPPPIVHAPLPTAAPVPVRAAPPKPAPPPEPEYEDVDAIFERERSEVDPDALFASALARGESREEARKQVKAFMSVYDLPEDEWEPLDATVCNEIVSANGSNAVRYADDTEAQASELDADARDARPH